MLSAYAQPTRTCRMLEQVRPLTGCDRLTKNAVGPAAVVKTLVVCLGVGGEARLAPELVCFQKRLIESLGPSS